MLVRTPRPAVRVLLSLTAVLLTARLFAAPRVRSLTDDGKALYICTQNDVYIDAYIRRHMKEVETTCPTFEVVAFETCYDRLMRYERCLFVFRRRSDDDALFLVLVVAFATSMLFCSSTWTT